MKNNKEEDLRPRIIKWANRPRKPRVLHRYHASEIWGLLTINYKTGKPYTTPEDWVNGKVFDEKGSMNVWHGTFTHEKIQSLYPEYEQELPKVYEKNGIIISGKADLINETEVIELKSSLDKVHDTAKSWHIFQLKLYLTMFERSVGRVGQPFWRDKVPYLKWLGTYKRSDSWFEGQVEKLGVIDKLITKHYESI